MKETKKCKNCGKEFKIFKTTDKWCSQECFKEGHIPNIKLKPLKSIPKVSEKRKIEDLKYRVMRIEFLGKPENKKCPITGEPTTEIHHMRKRRGFADEWARENNVSLYLDTRFWLAVSREGHDRIESFPEWAFENGYSIKNNQK